MTKKFLLTIASAILLTACGGTSSVLSSSNGNENSSLTTSSNSSTVSNPFDVDGTREKLFDLLSLAKNNNNFSYGYLEDEQIVNSIKVTDEFIYSEQGDAGYFLLPTPKGDEEVLYSVFKVDDEYQINSALSKVDENSSRSPYHQTSELNYLSLLDLEEITFNKDSLINQSDYFYVEDENLVTIFANMFSLGNYVNGIMRVAFHYNANDTIEVVFAPNFYDGTNPDLIDATRGIIYDINQTEDKNISDYINDYRWDEGRLSEDNLSLINGTSLTYNSDMVLYFTPTGSSSQMVYSNLSKREITYDYSRTKKKVVDTSTGVEEKTYYSLNSNNEMSKVYVSAENQVTYESMNLDKEDVMVNVKETLDLSQFVKVDDNLYRYYGYLSEDIVFLLTEYELGMGYVLEMYAHVENNNLTSITAVSQKVELIGQGTFEHKMTLTFKNSSTIEDIEAYQEDEDTSSIQALFDKVNAAQGYQLKTYNKNGEDLATTITVKNNVALIDEYLPDLGAGTDHDYMHFYSGYVYQDGEGVAPFDVNDVDENGVNKVAVVSAEAKDGYESIDDYIGLRLDARAFEFTDATKTKIKPKDNVRNLANNIPGGPYVNEIIDSSLVMNVENNQIVSYSYNTYDSYNNVLDTDYVDITYESTLPEFIDFSNVMEIFVVPTTWKDGAPEVYQQLQNAVNEGNKEWLTQEVIDTLPYLYDEELNEGWYIDIGNIEFTISNKTYYEYIDPTNFMGRYKELLLENGWTYDEANDRYTKVFDNRICYMLVADSPFGGIRFQWLYQTV